MVLPETRTLVGRTSACQWLLESRHVSAAHASFQWTTGTWDIRDLGSRNGTWVDGKRLNPGDVERLKEGSRIAFGEPEDAWELVETSPPGAVAQVLSSGEYLSAASGMLALPSEEVPSILVFRDSYGVFYAEQDGERRMIQHGDVLTDGTAQWRILLPQAVESTVTVIRSAALNSYTLQFEVSRDEEHTTLVLVRPEAEVRLEPRAYWYVILTLARLRVEDAAHPPEEQGWVEADDLAKQLGTDNNGLSVAIYRARKHLQAEGIAGSANLVEVRRGQRRIGITPDRIVVARS